MKKGVEHWSDSKAGVAADKSFKSSGDAYGGLTGVIADIERAIKSLASGNSGYKSPGNSIKHEVKDPLK